MSSSTPGSPTPPKFAPPMDAPPSAIALRYDPASGDASPRVVAVGKGAAAEAILRLAAQHDIPLRQDAALTEALSHVELGASIPPELFRAVAEVLAWVYKLGGKP